jgi:O-antigen biosynthesis protein
MSFAQVTAKPPSVRKSACPAPVIPGKRVTVAGKFFRCGAEKFWFKGVTYGGFGPGPDGAPFPSRVRVARDFEMIRQLGANGLRVYDVPPPWLLDLAEEQGLRLFVDIPWPKDRCFLDDRHVRRQSEEAVRQAVMACGGHRAVFAFSVANEIPADIVRWSGARRVAAWLERLIEVGRGIAPEPLYTYASFPPTEFLHPRNTDFVCFNVFLHERKAFEQYLARLQLQAAGKPLVLGEYGVDSLRQGETVQAEMMAWQTELAFRMGLSGAVVFAFTDDWHRGGMPVEDWAFGLTRREREPKPAYSAVQAVFQKPAVLVPPRYPKMSVVVACHNGERTLAACLDSLLDLDYPDYEVILVDDGSTDRTAGIAAEFESVRYVHQPHSGLSVARNTGIAMATGEVIAFTDADCRTDEHWLRYMVGDLLATGYAGIGGPNYLPPEDSRFAAAVMASPGGPTHVMLTDREAEHVPGCNMAFHRWALEDIGGFDPMFRKAGDDVDLCWRLHANGHRIGFSPAGFVWHYRRSTPTAYLSQQFGYGEAEALLARKHPGYFNFLGGGVWRGRIYAPAQAAVRLRRPIIYHGLFGGGLFQKLYAPVPESLVMGATSLEYHVLVNLPLLALAIAFPGLWPVFGVTMALPLTVCGLAAAQADLPRGKQGIWSRPLVAIMFLLQPLVRGWARYRWRFTLRSLRPTTFHRPLPSERWRPFRSRQVLSFWSHDGTDRYRLLDRILKRWDDEGWQARPDSGWGEYDAEIYGPRWSRLRLTTVAEESSGGRKLLRCRLATGASLRARLGLGAMVLGLILVLEAWATAWAWPWLLVALVPLWVWRVELEKQLVRRLVATSIREVADELGLTVLNGSGQTVSTGRADSGHVVADGLP